MTAILHQLRSRSRALAPGLLLVLLATWLAAVCPHCLAQAAEIPEPAAAGHCHDGAPAELPVAAHDCCSQAAICGDTGCAQLSNLAAVEPTGFATVERSAQLPPVVTEVGTAYASRPPSPVPVAQRVAADPCPLYLRHCTFLN